MAKKKRYMSFRLDGLLFGVELDAVTEVVPWREITPVPHAPDTVEGLINLRSQIVTAIDLRRALDLDPRPPEDRPMNLIIRLESELISLLIDEAADVLDLSEADFEPPPRNLRGRVGELILGAYKLPEDLLLPLKLQAIIGPGVVR